MQLNSEIWKIISSEISSVSGIAFEVKSIRQTTGGDINQSFTISDDNTTYFVKLNDVALLPMFEQEAFSLNRLCETNTFIIPTPLVYGITKSHSYLVLSHHSIQAHGDHHVLGKKLACLHRHTQSHYGWAYSNFIGSSPQKNTPHASWQDFWREQRLLPQLELAYRNGYSTKLLPLANQLVNRLPCILEGHEPNPALLHGDLWGGNAGFTTPDQPILFDPACYYGDRETDLAMTELFGGFRKEFYISYNETWPLPEGYSQRKPLYQLYHMLNHLNLFGSSYLAGCKRFIEIIIKNIY